MNSRYVFALSCLVCMFFNYAVAQEIVLKSPDEKISVVLENDSKLSYAVAFDNQQLIEKSTLGFEFKNEPPMNGDFEILNNTTKEVDETWTPVVKLKHAEIRDHYREVLLNLKEKSGLMRNMDLIVRAYNDGVAFRYKLYRSEMVGQRQITNELTTFAIVGEADAWVAEYNYRFTSSQEDEYFKMPVTKVYPSTLAGLPFLTKYNDNCWMAITEANMDNYSGFYLAGSGQSGKLVTKLAYLPGEGENGVKVRFGDEIYTPWRVMMIGDSPGVLIESEIIRNLNEPCAIEDPSWIKPGKSAWDNWWSGGVKMEMPVIKEYIDLAAEMSWEYMLVDWQWYGQFNQPEADITTWAPQIDMPEIIRYAISKNVDIILWLYSKDVNRNSAYKKAFPLYHEWGVKGIKIDFMDREDQDMVNWYRDIIKCAAENKLLVDFHGAFKPDGIIRTYPNMITREGVMGNEYYQFSDRMNPEHNVKLSYTRMLAGQMDYTPGGFLNVTKENFKHKSPPTKVWNTRAAELAKFVIYESPLTVVCDHPRHILGEPGADFLKIVPTVWDDTKFLGGTPEEYVAIARKDGNTWYVGVLNNSKGKTIEIPLTFLQEGEYKIESWSDTKNSNAEPIELNKQSVNLKTSKPLKVTLANNGGYAAVITQSK